MPAAASRREPLPPIGLFVGRMRPGPQCALSARLPQVPRRGHPAGDFMLFGEGGSQGPGYAAPNFRRVFGIQLSADLHCGLQCTRGPSTGRACTLYHLLLSLCRTGSEQIDISSVRPLLNEGFMFALTLILRRRQFWHANEARFRGAVFIAGAATDGIC